MVKDGHLSFRDYAKVTKSIQQFKLATDCPSSTTSLQNFWLWGKPGVGKSSLARRRYPKLFDKSLSKWWDGYQHESAVLLDDFGTEHACLGHYLKRWSDHYPFKAETKGGTSNIRPKHVLVTSNYHPRDIWSDKPVDLEAIERRFKIIEMTSRYFVPWLPAPED